MKCKFFENEECDSGIISDKQCANCLSAKSLKMMITLNDKLDAMEKPTKRVNGRAKKVSVTG